MVRVGFPGGPRLEWYDRAPISQSLGWWALNVAPHTTTVRATYTVPAGKKAFLGGACIDIIRTAAATAVGWVSVTVAAGTDIYLVSSHLNNAVGWREPASVNFNAVLLAGQAGAITSTDLSTGGTLTYFTCLVIMEFSA